MYHRLQSSAYPGSNHDEDQDYQLALELSAELNGEPISPQHDADVEYALALQLEFDNEMKAAEQDDLSLKYESHEWEISATSSEIQASWELNDTYFAEYHQEALSETVPRDFTSFTNYLVSFQCICGEPPFRSELDVNDVFQDWLNGKAQLSCLTKCRNCLTSSCLARTLEPFTKLSTLSAQNKRISWCCSGGRLFLIWILLCEFDQRFCAARTKQVSKVKQTPPIQTRMTIGGKLNQKIRDSGIGFGGNHRLPINHMPSGMGYGSDMMEYEDLGSYFGPPFPTGKGKKSNPHAGPREGSKFKAQVAQKSEDDFNTMILELLKGLLPSLDRDSAFDIDPPEAVTDLLLNSKILGYCAELLRNDSLEDATKRHKLYSAMLTFLQTLGMHIMATRTLFSDRLVQPEAINLLTLSFSHAMESSKESASSLANGLRNLATQSVLVLQSAKSNEKDFHTQEGQNMLLLCRQISQLSQYILANTGAPPENNVQIPENLVISDVPDDQILVAHAYDSNARSLAFSPPGRFKRLITEITTLKTGLPPGIFVRYCENRPDVLKVVIVGPMGTPYENGIFEFDFFCDANFPNQPPLVLFKGTGGGRVSINPNLYHDGKVCLSLLGTWQGEPWKPGESTLLQVVLSLQAMIFCEEPWYNEPGREASYRDGSKENPSMAYNQDIRQHTVNYAMLPWLDQSSPLWGGVVEHHFKANANVILQTVEEWARNENFRSKGRQTHDDSHDFIHGLASIGNVPPFRVQKSNMESMLPRLQIALQRYGATYIIKNVAPVIVAPPVVPGPPVPQPAFPHPSQTNYILQPPMGPLTPYGQTSPYSFTQSPPPPPLSPVGRSRGVILGMGRGRMLGNRYQAEVNTTSTASNNPTRTLSSESYEGSRGYEARGRGGSGNPTRTLSSESYEGRRGYEARGRGGSSRFSTFAGRAFGGRPRRSSTAHAPARAASRASRGRRVEEEQAVHGGLSHNGATSPVTKRN